LEGRANNIYERHGKRFCCCEILKTPSFLHPRGGLLSGPNAEIQSQECGPPFNNSYKCINQFAKWLKLIGTESTKYRFDFSDGTEDRDK